MKKLLLSIFTCLSVYSVSAVDNLTGSYTGTLNVTLGEGEEAMPADPTENVKVFTEKDAAKNTLTLILRDFSFMDGAVPVGDIAVPDVTVDENGVITAPEIVLDKTDYGLGELPTTLSGTLTPQKADLEIRVLWGVTPIFVTYVGDKDGASSLNSIAQFQTVYANNILTVPGSDILSYKVYAITGTIVAEQSNITSAIDLNQYPAGIYLIEAQTNNGSVTRKVYKN